MACLMDKLDLTVDENDNTDVPIRKLYVSNYPFNVSR